MWSSLFVKSSSKKYKLLNKNIVSIIDSVMNIHGLDNKAGGGGGKGTKTIKSGNTQVITKKEQKPKQ